MNAAARLHSVLQSPTVAELAEPLPAIGEMLALRLSTIQAKPRTIDVDGALRELGGLTAQLMRLRLALVQEATTE